MIDLTTVKRILVDLPFADTISQVSYLRQSRKHDIVNRAKRGNGYDSLYRKGLSPPQTGACPACTKQRAHNHCERVMSTGIDPGSVI